MFAGLIVRRPDRPLHAYASEQRLINALTPFHKADASGSWANDSALIAQALIWNTPESKHESTPQQCPHTGRIIASWVRLDNRGELCVKLGLDDMETLTDPQIILAAHQAWGEACTDRLEGDFSFVIHQPVDGTTFCARDSVGARPFYFYASDELFIFATTAAIFPALDSFPLVHTEEWAVRHMVWYQGNEHSTAFEGVRKLPAAHQMMVTPGGDAMPYRYFAFDPASTAAKGRKPHWVDDYQKAFYRAVDDRGRSAYLIGAESSGGIDSSSILARAVDSVWHGPDAMHCFGISEYHDEPEYLLLTAQQHGIRNNHVFVRNSQQHPVEVLTRVVKVFGYPPEFGIPYNHAPFYEGCAEKSIRTLYSGYGGDEMVTSKGHLFHRELYLNRQFGTLFNELPGPFSDACIGLRGS